MQNICQSCIEVNGATFFDSTIRQEQGYLGNYPRTLRPRDIQKMTFQPGNEGPFYLSPQQRKKNDLTK
jgi:hypothetical protein